MHRSFAVLIVAVSCLAPGCGGDDVGRLFAELSWQVRCDETGGCSGIRRHDIAHLDGEDSNNISCTVEDGGSDRRVMNFSVLHGSEYGITIRNAVFRGNGSPLEGTCTMTVREQGNDFVGSCGASYPSELQPCRVADIEVFDEDDGPTVAGSFICAKLTARADRTLVREVTAPGNPTAVVTWRFVNCRGL